MEFGYGDSDDFSWEGLACPPLDDFAFDFDETCNYKLDGILDDPLLEGGEEHSTAVNEVGIDCRCDQDSGVDKKAKHLYGNHGRGKELKELKELYNTTRFAGVENKRKADFDLKLEASRQKMQDSHKSTCQPMQSKDTMQLYNTTRLAVVENKKKADFDLKLEASRHKGMKSLNHTKELGVVDNKRKADTDIRLEAKRHKLHKPLQPKNRTGMDHMHRPEMVDNKKNADIDFRLVASKPACQPMWREDKMSLDYSNQLAVADKKMQEDYSSRFEASRKKLHESYNRVREAKQTKKIQVIDFQKPVKECQAKSKGKSSLRQRLMAMGTHKGNKRLQLSAY